MSSTTLSVTPGWGPAGNSDAKPYHLDPGLANAVNIALILGRPLLVSGEPGCGKTELAYRVARELNLGKPLRFDTKSSSLATDLFYHYDTVGRFGQAQLDALERRPPAPLSRFLRLHALGLAIARTLPVTGAEALFGPGFDPLWPDGLERKPVRSVVLIDEVDKAPRDFPNDLLNEIEEWSFRVPEAGIDKPVKASDALRPIVLLTSNSESRLPEAFLRRCVYHHVRFPSAEALREIIQRHLNHSVGPDAGLDAGLGAILKARDSSQLERKPSTSEIIDFMKVLVHRGWKPGQPFGKENIQALLGCLFKTEADLRVGGALVVPTAS
jgi:MoxR-like ATPase